MIGCTMPLKKTKKPQTDLHDLRESDKSFDTDTVCNGWFRIKIFQNSKQNSCFGNFGNLVIYVNQPMWLNDKNK